ncbi:uncharacterized protein LOC103381282 isoform X2 [Cynoglossus semilaevis]|uniref:uncharacterized protein LOC103381282 isoform X2 n=1 Tax=Cynoglossus semilaevis TaxID=244447 RepID=UPI000496EB4D|nr:uncharacterized protein LOC103381282 isoform X2 [Cynoglossus semilaevis]XP_024912572.1 uncharacterized protein LOC103381282 isoform X2 [Cynoglossus semilaevis]XP_024912573.1 uncharacterized protein LOC103381282 isoform X2 [Cynoglossus semilaevis]
MSSQRNYQTLQKSQKEMNRMPWKTFYVFVAGQTNNTHNKIVKMLTNSGHSESVSPEDCDYCVVFCPVVSRLESDVSSALNNSPAGKPIILVVMHYHHDPQQTVIQSHRSVENPNVHLTVDCLFYKDQLLKCNTNDEASSEILKFLGLEQGSSCKNVINCLKVSLLAGLVVAVVVLTVIFSKMENKSLHDTYMNNNNLSEWVDNV